VTSEVRPLSPGKKRAYAPREDCGVGAQALMQRIAEIMSGRAETFKKYLNLKTEVSPLLKPFRFGCAIPCDYC